MPYLLLTESFVVIGGRIAPRSVWIISGVVPLALAAWLKTLIAASLVSVGEINHAAGRCPYRSKMACRRTLLAVP